MKEMTDTTRHVLARPYVVDEREPERAELECQIQVLFAAETISVTLSSSYTHRSDRSENQLFKMEDTSETARMAGTCYSFLLPPSSLFNLPHALTITTFTFPHTLVFLLFVVKNPALIQLYSSATPNGIKVLLIVSHFIMK